MHSFLLKKKSDLSVFILLFCQKNINKLLNPACAIGKSAVNDKLILPGYNFHYNAMKSG
jgi:hypothetical protein